MQQAWGPYKKGTSIGADSHGIRTAFREHEGTHRAALLPPRDAKDTSEPRKLEGAWTAFSITASKGAHPWVLATSLQRAREEVSAVQAAPSVVLLPRLGSQSPRVPSCCKVCDLS